jgi:hypothetical protein
MLMTENPVYVHDALVLIQYIDSTFKGQWPPSHYTLKQGSTDLRLTTQGQLD